MTDKAGNLGISKNRALSALNLTKPNVSPLKFESFQDSLEAAQVASVIQLDVISSAAAEYTAERIKGIYNLTDVPSLARISFAASKEGISDISNYSLNEAVELRSKADEFVAQDSRHENTLSVIEIAVEMDHPQYAEFKATVDDIVKSGIAEKYEYMSSSKGIGTKFITLAKEGVVENKVNLKKEVGSRTAKDFILVA